MIQKLIVVLAALLISISAAAQLNEVTGRVVDKANLPLPGVNCAVKGEFKGAITNANGEFVIKCKTVNPTIGFSMVSFKSVEVKVVGNKPINVVLEEDNIMIKETVVIGYGTKKTRESLVGAVEQMNAKQLEGNFMSESIDKVMEGRMAGVLVDNTSGDVGSAASVRIRGQGSLVKVLSGDIVASSEPLYIIDGVPMNDVSEPNRANAFGETRLNPLSLINPDDIETVTVLKDAATAAIYGANGGNGVILITTKKGRAGKSVVSVSQNFSYSESVNLLKYLNTEDYVKLAIEAQTNSGVTYDDAVIKAGPTNINTNWYDLVLRKPWSTQTNISISGGNSGVTYRFSGGYNNTKTVSLGNEMGRFTSRLNLSTKLNEKVGLDVVLGFSTSKKDIFNVFGNTFAFKPNLSPYNADGTFNNTPPFDVQLNPLAGLAQNQNWRNDYLTSGSARLYYEVIKGLTASSSIAVDYSSSRNFRFDSKKNALGRNSNGRIYDIYAMAFQWTAVSQLSWEKTFHEKHAIQAMVGFQADNKESSGLKANEKDLPFEILLQVGLGGAENSDASATDNSVGSISSFSQLSYSYDNKYHISYTFRRDASSLFGGDMQTETFNSVGGSWIITKEPWFEKSNLIPFAKLRASYGKTGNSRVGSYAARGTYSYGSGYSYNGEFGASPQAAPNRNLTWEKNYKLTIGADFSVGRRMNFMIDYYENRVIDAISSVSVPLESGFTSVSANTADMKNVGWEFSLKTKNFVSKDFSWNSNFNIATNTNRITRLSSGDYIPQTSKLSNMLFVGKDVSSIYSSRYAGVDPQTGNPIWYLKDGTITTDTELANSFENRTIVGKSSPDWFGGFVNDFDIYDFTLTFVMTYQIGGQKIMPYQVSYTNSDGRKILEQNQSVNQLDRWTTPGQITDVPRLNMNTYPTNQTTRFLFDMTNICFKSVSLSYKIPSKIAKLAFISNAKINASINNIGYWYREGNSKSRNGIAEYRYSFPEARTLTIGIDLRF